MTTKQAMLKIFKRILYTEEEYKNNWENTGKD
jgi:hypothetical protein